MQAALSHCGNANPIDWLRDNWSKLIDTVQTLATKYGQERKENIIGTISAAEAREALRTHKGNVWHSVTECIEQRQRKFQDIVQRGNYAREDIVTALTAHQGNMDLALIDLGKTHIKPFLMRIWGPPAGADNDSTNEMDPFMDAASAVARQSIEYNSIQEFMNNNRDILDGGGNESSTTKASDTMVDNSNQPNPGILRDIETLIGNMEQTQAKQNEDMLKNIESLLGNILHANHHQQSTRPQSQSSNFSVNEEVYDRMNVKSPIPVIKNLSKSPDHQSTENDVRYFLSQHIQDVAPDLVEHVEQGLNSDETVTNPLNLHKSIDRDNEEILIINRFLEQELKNSEHNITKETFVQVDSVEEVSDETQPSKDIVSAVTSVTELPQMSEVVIEFEEPTHILHNAVDITNYAVSNAADDVVEETVQTLMEEDSVTETLQPIVDQLEQIVKVDPITIEVQTITKHMISNNNQTSIDEIKKLESLKKKQVFKQKSRKGFVIKTTRKPNVAAFEDNKKTKKAAAVKPNISHISNQISPASVVLSSTELIENVSGTETTISASIVLPTELVENVSETTISADLDQFEVNELTVTNTINANKIDATQLEIVEAAKSVVIENNLAEEVINIAEPMGTEVPTVALTIDAPSTSNPIFEEVRHQDVSTEQSPQMSLIDTNKTQTVQKKKSRIPVRKTSSTIPPTNEVILEPTSNHIVDPVASAASENSSFADTQIIAPTRGNELNLSPSDTDIESIITATEFNGETSASERESFSDDSETEHESEGFEAIASTSTTAQLVDHHHQPSTGDGKTDNKNQQNLSELVSDTQRLIKQMKDEINSDIASFISDDDEDYSEYSDWTENGEEEAEFDDEEGEEEYDEEEEEGEYEEDEVVANGAAEPNEEDWTDTEGEYDSEYYEDIQQDEEPNTNSLQIPAEITAIDSDSIENELFVEAEGEVMETIESPDVVSIVVDIPTDELIVNPVMEETVPTTTEQNIDNIQKSLNQTINISMERRSSKEINLADIMAVPISQLPVEVIAEIEMENVTSDVLQLEVTVPQQESELDHQLPENNENQTKRPTISLSTAEVEVIAEIGTELPDLLQQKVTPPQLDPELDHQLPENSENQTEHLTNPHSEAEVEVIAEIEMENTNVAANIVLPNNENEQPQEDNTVVVVQPTAEPDQSVNHENLEENMPSSSTSDKSSPLNSNVETIDQLPSSSQPSLTNKTKVSSKSAPKASPQRKNSDPHPGYLRRNSGSGSGSNTETTAVTTVPTKKTATVAVGAVKVTKKIPIRKTSLPGPFGSMIRTSNVKQMQQELMSKSSKTTENNSKPSKIVPPKVIKPIVSSKLSERITKFIKPFTSGAAGGASVAAASSAVASSSSSKVAAIGAVGKREIPKKKYHETCFSDDYQSSDSDEDDGDDDVHRVAPSTCRQMPKRQQSMPNIMQSQLDLEEENVVRRASRLLAEGKVANFVEAELAAELISLKFSESSALWAATECSTLEHALSILQQECELCTGIYPMNRIVTMLKCTHSCCQDCAKNYFTIQVRINDCNP